MARGYPDYFGLPIFPSYGSYSEQTELDDTILNGENADVFKLELKARIYGLYLRIHNTDVPGGVTVKLTIDGTVTASYALSTLFERQWGMEGGYPLKFSEYDLIGTDYCLVGAKDLVFGKQFILNILNASGDAISTFGSVHYARILSI